MQFDAHCIECLVHRHFRLVLQKDDGKKAYAYLRDVMQAILDAPEGVSAPYLTGCFSRAWAKYWPGEDAYARLKQEANDLVLELLPRIRPIVEQAADPLEMAMKFAQTGNFLDFGILTPEAAHKALWDAVEQTPSAQLDQTAYEAFLQDVGNAAKLLILGDNCGEIVFDLLLVEQLKKSYPKLEILYCVRGQNALNDATPADAAYVGMDRLCTVLDNGSDISGTEPDYAGPALKQALETADVILSKGSGNMEAMAGRGYNAYYLFMCKCGRVSKLLGCENMAGQFLRERSLPPLNPFVGAL